MKKQSKWLLLGLCLSLALPAMAADRVGAMPDRQVRPGTSLPIWGNAGNGGGVGDGTANGEAYSWTLSVNPNVMATDDGDLTGTVGSDKYIVESVTFALLNGSTRESVMATLDVGGTTKSVIIDIVDSLDPISLSDVDNLKIDSNIAIDDGLRYLYLQQLASGLWPGSCTTTSFALWAMSNSGHEPTADPADDIYAEWVRKGLTALAATETISNTTANNADVAREATADNVSDVNTNGQSSYLCGSGSINYQHPIALAAFIAARDPANYQRIVEDGIDYIGRSQNVSGQRGGWNYTGPSTRGDMSVDSWNFMALEGAAATNYNVDAPDWIAQEGEYELISHQTNAAGSRPFGYTSGNPLRGFSHGQATTCGGLSGLALVETENTVPVGDILDDQAGPLNSVATRRQAALDYLGDQWGVTSGNTSLGFANRGNYYTMWTCCRALRLTEDATGSRVVLTNGGVDFDWETGEENGSGTIAAPGSAREGYGPFLTRTQASNGAWSNGTYLGSVPMQTALSMLCLNPTVFGAACVDIDGDGFGDPGDTNCSGGAELDCDPNNPDVNAGVDEICDNQIDDDCDGRIDADDTDCGDPMFVVLESFSALRTKRGVQVSWSTLMEIDNVGFRVLRGYDFDRDLEIMTHPMIPARGTELSGASYTWIDGTSDRSGAMYYYLEDIDLNGTVTRHGPVVVGSVYRPGTSKPGARP